MKRTERLRSRGSFLEKWTNAKAALIGFYTGRGLSSHMIARALGDGTSAATVRRQWRLWGIGKMRHESLEIPLSATDRAAIAKRAEAAKLPIEKWCQNVLRYVAKDDMYDAVVDSGDD